MNDRALQIHNSRFLQTLLGFRWGRSVLNRFQQWSITTAARRARDSVPQRVRARAQLLVDDQERRGLGVFFLHLYDQPNWWNLSNQSLPPALRIVQEMIGYSKEQYDASPLTIPHDGHPTAEGARLYASVLAGVLAEHLATVRPR